MLKLLFTVAVAAVVWFSLKSRRQVNHGNIERVGRAFGAARRAMSASAESRNEAEPAGDANAVELRPCPRCGTYIAVGTACTCVAK